MCIQPDAIGLHITQTQKRDTPLNAFTHLAANLAKSVPSQL